MASAESLPTSVEALSLQSTASTSKFPGCFPTLNPVDIYREHISEALGKVAEVDPAMIYTRLQWTNTLDKGDLTLAVCEMT
jgi:arginyl-tRNA synthetase